MKRNRTESGDPVVSAAVTKLGHDSFAVLRELRDKISRIQIQEKRKKDGRAIAEEEEMPKKKSALERFGRDLDSAFSAILILIPIQFQFLIKT